MEGLGIDSLAAQLAAPEISIISLLINFAIGLVLSLIVAFFYVKYSSAISNKKSFAKLLPLLTLTTLFVITIVKSSLALSLGLVGALSIVRFRTPIKEPEDLVYLFVAIAIGLGLGAGLVAASIVGTGFLLCVLVGQKVLSKDRATSNDMFLSIETTGDKPNVEAITEVLDKHLVSADLRRLYYGPETTSLVLYLPSIDVESINKLVAELSTNIPDVNITLIDQSASPAL